MRRAAGLVRGDRRHDAQAHDAFDQCRREMREGGVARSIRRRGRIEAKGKADPPGFAIDQAGMDAQPAMVALHAAFQHQRSVLVEPGEERGADRTVQRCRGQAIPVGVMHGEGGREDQGRTFASAVFPYRRTMEDRWTPILRQATKSCGSVTRSPGCYNKFMACADGEASNSSTFARGEPGALA